MRTGFRTGLRRHILKGFALGCAIAAISAAQSLIAPANVVFQAALERAYYAPVILAGLWYGIPGGVIAALLSIVASVRHLDGWSLRAAVGARHGVDVAVYLLLGLGLGVASSRNRQTVRRVRDRVASLATTNRRMRAQGERCLREGRMYALEGIAAGLEQEIREPLSNLKAALQPAQATRLDDVCAVARRQLARLEAVLNEFIVYARPRQPDPQWTDLADLLGRVRTRLSAAAQRRGVSIEVEPQPGAPPLFVDPALVERMITNIGSNAVQASPRGSRVLIRATSHAGSRVIEVEDRGPGIAPEYLDRIFQPFFTTKERGTGLGLAIARQIADAHEGTIELRRQRRVGGTVVRIQLPERAGATTAGVPIASHAEAHT